MLIDLNKHKDDIFNPLMRKLQAADKRFVISYGGAGSSKSYTQTQHEIVRCLERKEKLLVIRKVASTLKDSVVSLFNTILSDWGLSDLCTEHIQPPYIEFENGSQILFKGLDDPEKIKSIAGITRIWIEEASELTKDDFNQLNLRLRGSNNLQMILTFNPIDEDHWLKKHFFDTPTVRERTDIIKTTYLDNNFIDDAYKDVLESYKDIDKLYYQIYALGEWGSLTEGRVFPIWQVVDVFPERSGYWYGLDFGFSNDPTAIVKTMHWNERIYLDEVCYQTGLTNGDIADLMRSEGYSGEIVICDSAEPKSIEELRRLGINAIGADKGKGSIMAGIDYLKRQKILVSARSKNIQKENRFYQWMQDKNGKYLQQPKDFMNHQIDAIRYAYSLGDIGAVKDEDPFLDPTML
jgi:phage terminase large subunit